MDLFATLTPQVRSVALAVRKLVRATLPRVLEVVDSGTRVVGYGYGTGYRDMVATIILSRAGVKLGLVRGAELPDPRHLLEGTGKVHRYIAFTDVQQVHRAGVKGLLKAAYGAWLERRDAV